MTAVSIAPVTARRTPLFLLSFRHRDELAGAAERAGWTVFAARRAERVERRFVACGATGAVGDARGAFEDGLAAARQLRDAAEANAAALLMLLSRGDVASLDAVLAAGATHYLASPFGEAELVQALRFAARHADRVAGSGSVAGARAGEAAEEAWRWRWHPGEGTATIGPSFARRLGIAGTEPVPLGRLWKLLGRQGAEAARLAVDRLDSNGGTTAFAHDLPDGVGRLAHHLQRESNGDVSAWVEEIEGESPRRAPRSRDPLTGLDDGPATRRWIDAMLRSEGGATLMLIGLTRFETINAAFGRITGDALLQGVARRIERIVREGTSRRRLTARIAGAEFAVGLPFPTSLDEAAFLARRIIDAVEQPIVSAGHVVHLSCRAGIATTEGADDAAAALLRRASAALAEARESDRAVVCLAEGDDGERDSRLEIDLRRALDQDEIELLFQPQVDMVSGAIVGVEALARWRHPRFGELGATTLFAAAERSEFTAQLSAHVQRKALAAAAAWPEPLRQLRLSVNITSADIARSGFAAQFLAAADAAGVARRSVTVEVTESGLIEDLNAAAALLAELRAGGLRVAIDDFGTGYSSLAYLKALPLDYLKIDQRLSQDITGDARDRVVVRGVIEMARSLGLAVIAEGVETDEQLSLLAEQGCNYYQGFLCSPPVDSVQLAALVAARG